MQHSPPSEADRYSAGQEILQHLSNPKLNYCVQKSPPLDPIVGHLNPVQTIRPYFFNIYFNIILSSMDRSSGWFISFIIWQKEIR